MATERRRRSKDKTKSKTASRTDHATGPTSVHDVPDHLLELILLHLDSSACLLRAAASCKRWRRLIADANFLRRFCLLHVPPIAGHFHVVDPDWSPRNTDSPVFVPSSSVTIVRRHFSLDFLPDSSDGGWELADSRGSLLLLSKRSRTGWGAPARSRCLPDLVVCDPLSRRHQGILGQPDTSCIDVFLLDGDHVADTTGGGHVGMFSFCVVAVLHEHHTPAWPGVGGKPAACVFTPGSDGGGWRRVVPTASTANSSERIRLPTNAESVTFVGRANGSLYWLTGKDSGGAAMLALDTATMAFSRVVFTAPDDIIVSRWCNKWSFRVIGGDDGAPRVVRLTRNELNVFARLQGSDEWVVEKIVPLLEATRGLPGHEEYGCFLRNAMIVAADDTHVLVTPQEKAWVFSVELETMEAEREHERNKYPGAAYPYELPWPPALKACSDHGRKRR